MKNYIMVFIVYKSNNFIPTGTKNITDSQALTSVLWYPYFLDTSVSVNSKKYLFSKWMKKYIDIFYIPRFDR